MVNRLLLSSRPFALVVDVFPSEPCTPDVLSCDKMNILSQKTEKPDGLFSGYRHKWRGFFCELKNSELLHVFSYFLQTP